MIRKKVRTPKQRALLRFKQKQPIGIGKTRDQIKRADDDRAAGVVDRVRAHCVARDGYCRCGRDRGDYSECQGPSEWAHLGEKKRYKTRRQAPEVRHTTKDSLMFCKKHHDQYDGRRRPRLDVVVEREDLGAAGPMRYIERAA